MSHQATPSTSSSSDALSPASNFFSLGAELLSEVQRIVGHSKVKAIRLTLGGRHIKDIPVSPATAIATVLVAVVAVVISNLRIEVVKE